MLRTRLKGMQLYRHKKASAHGGLKSYLYVRIMKRGTQLFIRVTEYNYGSEIQYTGKVERTGNVCIILREILLGRRPVQDRGRGVKITPRD